MTPSQIDQFDGWVILLRARGHVIKHAPNAAIKILWEAEDAVLQRREPNYATEEIDSSHRSAL
jgi:hypothetical protein